MMPAHTLLRHDVGRPKRCRKVEMSHKIAKLILEHASTFLERTEAIKTAHSLGMPLHEIHEYLDWLEVTSPRPNGQQGEQSQGPSQEHSPEKPPDK